METGIGFGLQKVREVRAEVEFDKFYKEGLEYERARRFLEASESFAHALDFDARHAGALYGRARCLRELEEYGAAQHVLNRGLFLHPSDSDLLNEQGALHFLQGYYDKALQAFEEALATDSGSEVGLEGKIKSLRLLGRFDEAGSAVDDALTKTQAKTILTERAWLYYDQKLYDQAVEAFAEADNQDAVLEEIKSLRRKRHSTEVEQVIEAAASRFPKDAKVLNERGRLYYNQEQYDRAVDAFEHTLAVEPNNEEALKWKSKSLRLRRRFDEAEKAIKEALDKLPGNPEILTERAWLYYDQKLYDQAVEAFSVADNQDALLEEIRSLREHRQFPECEQLIHSVLARLPQNAQILKESGWLYLDQKRYEEATKWFQKALEADPEDTDALRMKIFSLRVQRRFKEAETAIEDALSRHSDNEDLLNERGWFYYDQYQYDRAVEAFTQTLKVNQDNEDALQWKIRSLRVLRNFQEAERAIDEALLRLPDSAQVLHERGLVYYDCGEFQRADECYAKAIAKNANYLEPHFARVDVLKRLNRSNDALEMLQQLKRARPDDMEVRNQLGWFYLGRNDFIHAKQEFESILASDPSNVTGINGIGAIYFNEELYEKAEQEFRRALKLEPHTAVLHNNVAWALLQQAKRAPRAAARRAPTWVENTKRMIVDTLGDQRSSVDYFGEAEEHCRKALELDPNNAGPYGCLGVIALKREKLLESEDLLQKSVRLKAEEGNYVHLGALYSQMGRYDEAESILKKARETDRSDVKARLELGNVYLQTDRLKEAIRMFREALATDPSREEPHRAMAIALMRAGEFSEASAILRKAIRVLEEPKRWQLHLTLCQLLTELGDKNEDPDLYQEALKEVFTATALKPDHPAPYFHAGVVRYKLEDYGRALRSFRKCLKLDPEHFEAEQNARRLQALLWRERVRTRGGLYMGITLGVICLGLLGALWTLYFRTNRITQTMLSTMTPILLGLVFVAFLLPWLSRLKLPGMEAELNQPKEKISAGPTGSVGFGGSSITAGLSIKSEL